MRSLFKDKKAASLDNMWVAISFFAFALTIFLSMWVWSILSTGDIDADIFQQTTVGVNVKQDAQDFYDDIDNWTIMVYVFIHLAVIVAAFLLRSHPVMYVVGIFIIITMVFVTVELEDVWEEVYNDPAFTAAQDDMPKVNVLMNNFTKIEMVWAFLTLVILVGLARNEGII